MQITFVGKLTNWEEIKKTIFLAVQRSDFEGVADFERAIRHAGVENVNEALTEAGHEAKVQL